MNNDCKSSVELINLGLNLLPSSRQGIEARAKKEKWSFEVQPSRGRNGGLKFYRISSMPAEIQTAIKEKQAKELLMATAPQSFPAIPENDTKVVQSNLTDRQRQVESARKGVLKSIEDVMDQTGVKKEQAIRTVLTNAKMVGFEHLARLFELARDERGSSGSLPSTRTIKRWFAQREEENLVPKIKQADMSVPEWAPLFLKFWQVPQKVSYAHAYESFCVAILKEQPLAKLPSLSQCYRFVQKLGNVSRQKGRIGSREIKYIQPHNRREFLHLNPTDIYTCDGHCFDAEIINPDSGKPFRPEITSIIDIATRKIVGFSVGKAESAFAVLEAIMHACVTNGVMASFYTDNGGGYKNQMMTHEATGLMGRLGSKMDNSAPYTSQSRGVIERLHKSVWVRAAQGLQTYIGAPMDAQASQLAHKKTRQIFNSGLSLKNVPALRNIQSLSPHLIMDLDEFMQFCEWNINTYNNRPHRSLPKILDNTGKRRHMTPNELWALKIHEGAEIIKVSQEEKHELFLPQVMRTVQRGEVSFRNNIYFSNDLTEYNGDVVRVAYDQHDAEFVWIYDDKGRLICRADWHGNH